MSNKIKNLPVCLIVMDGWGIAASSRGNAISQANTPFFDSITKEYKTFAISSSGEAVGLPWGEAGNSEVGHQNLGAGKIVYQEVLKINKSIEDNSFFDNEVFQGAISHCKKHNSSLHILGILSDGGVHGHQDHLYAALELASRNSLSRVSLHIILDGRDVAYNSGLEYVLQLGKIIKRLKVGSISTISGRFYAMDRDNHWERTQVAYKAMVNGDAAQTFSSAEEAIKSSYEKEVFDEELVPCLVRLESSNGTARVQPGDSLIFTNYRPDRARQISKAFAEPSFDKFKRAFLGNLYFAGMTEYENNFPANAAFRKESVDYPVARVISEAGLTQLHIAETEKYAHVTYFFNGGKDIVFKGQENVIIPSAGVTSYADKPEMSAKEIANSVVDSLKKSKYAFYVVNFANTDMVGHTGNLRATIKAVEVVDSCVKKVVSQVMSQGGVAFVTADHGNAEEMVNWDNGHIIKKHSTNPVPCVFVSEEFKLKNQKSKDFLLDSLKVSGVLSDISPTMLAVCGLQKPKEMTSASLI